MSRLAQIVCLAVSRKLQGKCVAGRELLDGKIGSWIRPVSGSSTGELYPHHIRYADGGSPRLRDIIELELTSADPSGCQVENWVISHSRAWRSVGRYPMEQLDLLCDAPRRLWTNGFSSGGGVNDRIPDSTNEASSLLFIQPSEIDLEIADEWGKRRIKAHFVYNRERYSLKVTDPEIERLAANREAARYGLDATRTYLCLSIGEPFEGYRYKLVAGLIMRPQGECNA